VIAVVARAVVSPCFGTGLGKQSHAEQNCMIAHRWLLIVAAAVWSRFGLTLAGSHASAQEKLRAGKAVAEAFAFRSSMSA
jgi:hypothetical protein